MSRCDQKIGAERRHHDCEHFLPEVPRTYTLGASAGREDCECGPDKKCKDRLIGIREKHDGDRSEHIGERHHDIGRDVDRLIESIQRQDGAGVLAERGEEMAPIAARKRKKAGANTGEREVLPKQGAHNLLFERHGLEHDRPERPAERRPEHVKYSTAPQTERPPGIKIEGNNGSAEHDHQHGGELAERKRLAEEEITEAIGEDGDELVEDDGGRNFVALDRLQIEEENEGVQHADSGQRREVYRAHAQHRGVDQEENRKRDGGKEPGEYKNGADAALREIPLKHQLVDVVRDCVEKRTRKGEEEPRHIRTSGARNIS